jgi:hypothetical protein
MEGLTRLVSDSMARHGFDRPLDYRRLHWSRWFRCESPHSLLFVPSKPGVFAVAEEITNLSDTQVATAASAVPPKRSGAESIPADSVRDDSARESSVRDQAGSVWDRVSDSVRPSEARQALAASATTPTTRRMLAVTQFFEDEDMAFVLDRMLSRQNPMQTRLISGRYFVRFVVIEDQTHRRTICNALNQWMVTAAEKANGIGSHFATSLELTPATEYVPSANDTQQPLFAGATDTPVETRASPVQRSVASGACSEIGFSASHSSQTAPQLDAGAATNIHCPFPSGF